MSPGPLFEAALSLRAAARAGMLAVLWLAWPVGAYAQGEQDRIDITGRQNLLSGSGARALGMGGAFLARADDATAASWNPAGLSYLVLPEISLAGVYNRFAVDRPLQTDRFHGGNFDFMALTWPIALGQTRGAVQLSYQRAIAFDGERAIRDFDPNVAADTGALVVQRSDDGHSDGGFDVVALGTGLRLTRSLRAGFTVNRWLNGYDQTLDRRAPGTRRPLREFELDFRPRGWNFNVGVMFSPLEVLNFGAVVKTPFRARVDMDKARRDTWVGVPDVPNQVTSNTYASDAVRLDLPLSYGAGLSWRPGDTVTLSADISQTRWSRARLLNHFQLDQVEPSTDGSARAVSKPIVYPRLQYPSLRVAPQNDDPYDPLRLAGQQDSQQIRFGVEWMIIRGTLRFPLRAGYFNDRQIERSASGGQPRFNGFTMGAGISVRSLLVDLAYVRSFGQYNETASDGSNTPTRNATTTNRVFASLIYRFDRRP